MEDSSLLKFYACRWVNVYWSLEASLCLHLHCHPVSRIRSFGTSVNIYQSIRRVKQRKLEFSYFTLLPFRQRNTCKTRSCVLQFTSETRSNPRPTRYALSCGLFAFWYMQILVALLSQHNSKYPGEIQTIFLSVKPCLLVANWPTLSFVFMFRYQSEGRFYS